MLSLKFNRWSLYVDSTNVFEVPDMTGAEVPRESLESESSGVSVDRFPLVGKLPRLNRPPSRLLTLGPCLTPRGLLLPPPSPQGAHLRWFLISP
jgi:hypothetical protein